MKTIDITKLFHSKLLSIANPVRYTGGEFIYGKKQILKDDSFTVGLCFPDLYEIGTSNNAMRILYDIIVDESDELICDRVFSVAPDFEAFLKQHDTPIYTLTHGIPVGALDVLAFSVGYELSATNILQVLDLGNISLLADERSDKDPIVLIGGPAVTNPLPFSSFIDFTYIGEAENGLIDILKTIKKMKKDGSNRLDIIDALKQFPMLYHKGKSITTRSVDDTFSEKEDTTTHNFVMPHFKVAQDHGVVEIMRGCPNGCRFCHAGQFYKPYRQKSFTHIYNEIKQQVTEFGYREVTLSSLSSGDHPQLQQIINHLNSDFSPYKVSFSLPSLKVSSFSLDILESLQEVRKSGLTFAIETPLTTWQRAMNKEVPLEDVIAIIQEAKMRGWKSAKFYFMVGLPFVDVEEEKEAIVSFLKAIRDATKINMNINIGTFIPKPHTPFQYAAMMRKEVGQEHLHLIKREIMYQVKGAKISYHDPAISYLEGIISRGDESVSKMIHIAYNKGARLDAWHEYFDPNIWYEAIEEANIDVESILYRDYSLDEKLPWDMIYLGVSKLYLKREYLKAKESLLTGICEEVCELPCGACSSVHKVHDVGHEEIILDDRIRVNKIDDTLQKVPSIFIYEKSGRAVYLSHINVMRIFEQTFQRSGIQVAFTQGFNPKPKMEFVNPLATGVSGSNEVMAVDIFGGLKLDEKETLSKLNAYSPVGFTFKSMQVIDTDRRVTLSKHLGGSIYTIQQVIDDEMKVSLDNLSKTCSKEVNVARLNVKGNTIYTVIIHGEKNPLKTLFGNERDKFDLLSKMKMHRETLFIEIYEDSIKDYALFGSMWQK